MQTGTITYPPTWREPDYYWHYRPRGSFVQPQQSSIIQHQSSRHHHYYYNDNHNKNNLQLRPGMAMLPGSLHRSSLLAVQDHARSQKGRLRLFSLARSPILHASTLARLVSKLVPAMPLKAMRMTMLPPNALTCCQCTVRQGHPMPRGLTVVRWMMNPILGLAWTVPREVAPSQ